MTEKKWKLAAWALLAVGVACYGVVVVRTAWLCDDAYITLRTVDNFVNGHGLRWNIAERVQTFTHPLWMMLLTVFYSITREAFFTTTLVSIGVSVAAVAVLVYGGVRSFFWGWLALGALIFSHAFIDYSTSGLENPLTHLLLAGFIAIGIHGEMSVKRLLMLALIASLGVLNRMDTALLFAPVLVVAWAHGPKLRGLGALALGALPFVAWEVFSVIYYGFPFPNTAYAKLSTGLSRPELIEQGLYYLQNAWMRDPLTIAVIVLGVAMPAIRGNARALALAGGIVFYIAYTIWIGGDFMSGRFFAAPFFVAVGLLTCWTEAERARWREGLVGLTHRAAPFAPAAAWVVALAILAYVGLGMPAQEAGQSDAPEPPQPLWAQTTPTVFSGADYGDSLRGFRDPHGIGDERMFYFDDAGLLCYTRERPLPMNRFVQAGLRYREMDTRQTKRHGSVGFRGFFGGPKVHIIDYYALADPLLARMPAMYNPNWRIGHFVRRVPEGYTKTADSLFKHPPDFVTETNLVAGAPWGWRLWGELGRMLLGQYNGEPDPADAPPSLPQNVIADDGLARYYDAIALVTRGPVWSRSRWIALCRLNTGYYDHLVDEDKYRFPDMAQTTLAEVSAPVAPGSRTAAGAGFGRRGLHVDLEGAVHAPVVTVVLDGNDSYRMLFMNGERIVAREDLGPSKTHRQGFARYQVALDDAVAKAGYDALRFFPIDGDKNYRLGQVTLGEGVRKGTGASNGGERP
ncbi:MAG: hypothetical protein ACLFTT_02735 [Candidatus Hydrogenedentota bacterium]